MLAGGERAKPDQRPVLGNPDGAGRHPEYVPGVLGGKARHHPQQEQPPLAGGQPGQQHPGPAGVDADHRDLLRPQAPVGQVG